MAVGKTPTSNLTATDDYLSRPLTRKERIFLEKYLELGDIGKAAKASGFYTPRKGKQEGKRKGEDGEPLGSRVNAIRAGMKVLKRIGPAVEVLMDQEGISMAALLRKLSEGLDATFTVAVKGEGKDKELVSVADHKHRAKYLEMALKMRSAFPAMPASIHVKAESGSIPVSLEVQHQESLKGKSVEELQAMLDEAINARKRGRLRVVGS